MSKTSNARRKGLAVLATSALVAGASLAGAGSAHAVADFKFKRLGGTDRYETASLVADEFAATNKTVILANGEPGNYADALSANTLAGELSAPILLTRTDKTPKFTLDQLKEDGVTDIYVVGGEGVVSAAQVSSLEGMGYKVTRVAGSDRFLTNAEVIKRNGTAKGATGLIATGFNFPDALAAGPISYQGHPLGLSATNNIEDSVVNALKAAGVTKVLIFGGESVVGPGVVAKLAANGITVEKRFAGADRSDTSQAAAEYALANLGFSNKHLGVASGYVQGFGADALAGGPLEGKEMAPMLVTRDVNNPDDVVDYMKDHANTLETGHLFGGTGAISASAQAAMEAAAKSATSNQDYTVTPTGEQTVQEGTVQQYSVSGITADEVNISLFGCDDVTTDANGVSTFKGTNPGGSGNVATDSFAEDNTTSHVTVVNGTSSTDTTDVDSSDGTVTFTVSGGNSGECYVPVVWEDADNDGNFDLGANGQPTEEFGVGAETEVIPSEGTDLTAPLTGTVEWVDKGMDAFHNGTNTFFYDSNDEFEVDGDAATLAEFEAVLSVGDGIVGTVYRSNPANQSRFSITDDAPAEVTALDQEPASGTNAGKEGIQLTWNESTTETVVSYTVYRALATQPTIAGQDVTCTEDIDDYTQIGTVADENLGEDGDDEHNYFDGTAQAPETTGGEDPSYCYAVVSVDEAGDVSDPVYAGPFQADEATADSGAPEFDDADAYADTQTIDALYDENIDFGGTVDGTEFEVRRTRGGVTTNVTAAIDTVVANGTDGVTITMDAGTLEAGDVVLVTVVQGDDTDTVGDDDTPQQFQPVGDSAQATVAAVDPTP